MKTSGFSGSYPPGDVTFLLTPIDPPFMELVERERLIQTGRAHYSEMIGREEAPSPQYLDLFFKSMDLSGARLAGGLADLATLIAGSRTGPLTLVSMARAGTPVGVILKRILERYFNRPAAHYSISIIRDRGLDLVALRHILDEHPPETIIFVDGWTAKGVIARELAAAVLAFNAAAGTTLSSDLYVLTDLRGETGVVAPACDDYLIPSCLLNAVVSGLISRSILNSDYLEPGDFHGCVFFRDLAPCDLSLWFVERCLAEIEKLNQLSPLAEMRIWPIGPEEKASLREKSRAFLKLMREHYDIPHENYIKPGLGEATRVLLRREPERLLIRSGQEPELEPILLLAEEKKVPVTVEPRLPYKAVALIRQVASD